MPNLDLLLDRNRAFAACFAPSDVVAGARLSMVILTCVDPRVDPARFFGLELGEAYVIRNPGAHVTKQVERSLAVLSFFTEQSGAPPLELAIVHHTDCAMERLAHPRTRQAAGESLGLEPAELAPLEIQDHIGSLRADVERLYRSTLVPDDMAVSGHIYDVRTGAVRTVIKPGDLAPRGRGSR